MKFISKLALPRNVISTFLCMSILHTTKDIHLWHLNKKCVQNCVGSPTVSKLQRIMMLRIPIWKAGMGKMICNALEEMVSGQQSLKDRVEKIVSKNKLLTLSYNDILVQSGKNRSRKWLAEEKDCTMLHQKNANTNTKVIKSLKVPKKLLPIPEKNNKSSLLILPSHQDTVNLLFTATRYWHLDKIHPLTRGKGTTIVILDGGFNVSHPAFTDDRMIEFQDFAKSDNNPEVDVVSHGTFCAGIACGSSFLYPAILSAQDTHMEWFPSGVAPEATYILCNVFEHGKTNAEDKSILQALEWIKETKKDAVDVLSLSLGFLNFREEISQTITELVNDNVIVVCAAGHKFSKNIAFPARLGNVLSIGSHDLHGRPSPFSPVGQEIDFLAPGENVAGPCSSRSGHQFGSGTSYATPAVAGLICLILSYIKQHHPDYLHIFKNHWMMKEILRKISKSPGRHSEYQGYGALSPLQFFQQPEYILNSVIAEVHNLPR